MGVALEMSFTEGGRKKVVSWVSARRIFQAERTSQKDKDSKCNQPWHHQWKAAQNAKAALEAESSWREKGIARKHKMSLKIIQLSFPTNP